MKRRTKNWIWTVVVIMAVVVFSGCGGQDDGEDEVLFGTLEPAEHEFLRVEPTLVADDSNEQPGRLDVWFNEHATAVGVVCSDGCPLKVWMNEHATAVGVSCDCEGGGQ